MADDTLRWLLDQLPETELDRRLKDLESQIAGLGQVRDALRVALNARRMAAEATLAQDLEALPSPQTSNGSKPGTRDAVRTIFRQSPTGTLTMTELMAELERRGWEPAGDDPRKLVGAAVSKLVHRTGELESAGRRATYRLKSDALRNGGASEETVSNRPFIGNADGDAASKGT